MPTFVTGPVGTDPAVPIGFRVTLWVDYRPAKRFALATSAGSTAVTAQVTRVVRFTPSPVAGSTTATARIGRIRVLIPAHVTGSTTAAAQVTRTVGFTPAVITGSSVVVARVTRTVGFTPAVIAGSSAVGPIMLVRAVGLLPATAAGFSTLAAAIRITHLARLLPGPVHGLSTVAATIGTKGGLVPGQVSGSSVVTARIAPIRRLVPVRTAGTTGISVVLARDVAFRTAVVAGSTAATTAIGTDAVLSLTLDQVDGSTGVLADLAPDVGTKLFPDLVFSQGGAEVAMALRGAFALDAVAGRTAVNIADVTDLLPDITQGASGVAAAMATSGVRRFTPAVVAGYTLVSVVEYPDLTSSTPILLALSVSARLEPVELLVSA